MFKQFIQKRLESYVKKYFKRHPEVKLVIVAGSVGKTTTKIAIGTVLAEKYRIRLHEGNHNAEISTPLAMLGIEYPADIKSVSAWLGVFSLARKRIREPSDVDVIIQEVGTDRIGQVPQFGTYATPDIAVITAVSAEHMEYFKTLDAVAAEELSAANYSRFAFINRDDIDGSYASLITNAQLSTYGTTAAAEYVVNQKDFSIEDGTDVTFSSRDGSSVQATVKTIGEHSNRAIAAAGAVGVRLGLTEHELKQGFEKITAVPGRMSILRGMQSSVLIDDTYNSSPLAAGSAIQTLYQLAGPQKIAVLGSMNELGETSQTSHELVGKLCDPSQLAHVIVVGNEAHKYLGPAAASNGCHVEYAKDAIDAGAYVHRVMESGSIILFKGSEGGIFLEEAVKVVLHSTEDESRLVRQSASWQARKQDFFAKTLL